VRIQTHTPKGYFSISKCVFLTKIARSLLHEIFIKINRKHTIHETAYYMLSKCCHVINVISFHTEDIYSNYTTNTSLYFTAIATKLLREKGFEVKIKAINKSIWGIDIEVMNSLPFLLEG
jgi:hypothetical protein